MAASALKPRNVHPFAMSNFTISGASGLYDSARPSYPAAALELMRATLDAEEGKLPKTGRTGVELGSGTGIFTRALLAHDLGKSFGKLVCAEPAEGMRAGFKVPEVPGTSVELVDGIFEDIPVPSGSVDAIFAAQCFHWSTFQPGETGENAIKEFARVLKPGGSVFLIWNLESRTVPWVAQIRDAYEGYENDTPQYRHMRWKSCFSTAAYSQFFGEPKSSTFVQVLPATEESVVRRILSKSYMTALSEEEKVKAAKLTSEVVKKGEGKTWIDEKEGVFEYPYDTDCWYFTKKA